MLAQLWFGGSFVQMAIALVIIVSICAIVYIVIKQSGLPIPGWVISILWVLILAIVAIFSIRFLAGL